MEQIEGEDLEEEEKNEQHNYRAAGQKGQVLYMIRQHATRPCQRRCSSSTAKWHNDNSKGNCNLSYVREYYDSHLKETILIKQEKNEEKPHDINAEYTLLLYHRTQKLCDTATCKLGCIHTAHNTKSSGI